jgi:hypothetical protein
VQEYDGVPVAELSVEEVDWTHRGEYIRSRSARKGRQEFDVEPEWADEAVHDSRRALSLDTASKSHETIRVVGWSAGAGRVLTVILLPKDRPVAGAWWGVNAWEASERDRREYWDQREE